MLAVMVFILLIVSSSYSKVEVFSRVSFDKTKGDYVYTYGIEVTEDSEEIILFTLYPLAPIYQASGPDGWSVLLKDDARVVWIKNTKSVKHVKRLCCFTLRSKYDVTIGYSELRGENTVLIDEVRVPGNEKAEAYAEVNPVLINLELDKPSFLSLYIRMPPDLKGREIDPHSIFLQGARPFMLRKICDGTYLARFDPEYLLLSSYFTRNVYLWGRFRDGTPFLGKGWAVVAEDKKIRVTKGKRPRTGFRVGSDFSLYVDEKRCRIDLTLPAEAHRALIKSLGHYEVYTEFPGMTCENLKDYVGKSLAPWTAFVDLNGDGKKDVFLRVLAGRGRVKKIVELFLVSSGDAYEVHRVWEEVRMRGKPLFYGRPKEILSPCRMEGVSGTWSMKVYFRNDCLALSHGSIEELATFYYLYINGRIETLEYVYEP